MAEKYLIFSLEDAKSKKLGEAISNPTSKKIISFLADSSVDGVSANDISKKLKIPLNSLDYNLKKLIEAGLVEKKRGFFWSSKGRKIERYNLVNKLIVISPKKGNVYSKLKGIIPVVLISSVLTGIVGMYYKGANFVQDSASFSTESLVSEGESLMAAAPQTTDIALKVAQVPSILNYFSPGLWFALGVSVAIIIFALWNWKKL